MADEVKNVIVKVRVEGDVKALNAIARIETALARQQATVARVNKSRKDNTTELQKNEKAMRQSAQANIQLNQQLQDFVIQAQGGQNLLVAFTQQAAQAAFVMSNTSGAASTFAKVLAGPLGTALFAAVAIFTPFITSLFDSGEAAKKAQEDLENLIEAVDATSEAQIRAVASTKSKIQMDLEESVVARKKLNELLLTIEAEQRLYESRLRGITITRSAIADEESLAISYANEADQLNRLSDAQQRNNKAREDAAKAAANARGFEAALVDANLDQILSRSTKAEQDFAAAIESATKARREGSISLEEYAKRSYAARVALQAAKDAAQAAEEAQREAEQKARERERERERENEKRLKDAKEWQDFLNEFAAGGKALYDLSAQLEKVKKALADPNLDKAGPEARLAATREEARLTKEIADKRAEIDAQGNIYLSVQREYAKFREETDKTMDRIAAMRLEAETAVNVEYRKWLLDNADALEQALIPALDEAAKKQKAFDDAVKKRVETASAGGKERQSIQQQIDEVQAAITKAGDSGDDSAVKILTKDLQDLELELQRLNMTALESKGLDLLVQGINEFADGMAAAIEGTKSFQEAFEEFAKSMIREITKLIVKWLLLLAVKAAFGGDSPIASAVTKNLGFAKGAAFEKGKPITAYAQGGIVTKPTFFPMANGGIGLMGEAGPEAVMPLTRTSDGKLGVNSSGMNVTVNNYTSSQVTTSQTDDGLMIEIRAAERARALVTEDIRRGGTPVSRAIEGTYGVNRGR